MQSITRRNWLASGLSVGAAALSGCGSRPVRAAVKPEKERKKAPEFALKDAQGRVAKLADYKGKVLLLNFWATWCGPCKIEIPGFIELYAQHKAAGFEVVGVVVLDDF